ncbi:hypothetical protein JMJ77_0006707 [Colletotrichum scovillei]|uniref:Uncharacterized protein n=1 Tax=Colletotrichum scovillei TaxID=1209932 RepID=A0A9P7RIP6_9PEZI|nr:hypothetical protein JMJ77_0006707 [Colletotrichum scovillei]KAG7077949.1 hypothetical protein JMJ76_0015189 [Colletotrichum scovillei]KAG7085047.1 hypothetical protein JMJ78_0010476 [Colletotrichum scovillei]
MEFSMCQKDLLAPERHEKGSTIGPRRGRQAILSSSAVNAKPERQQGRADRPGQLPKFSLAGIDSGGSSRLTPERCGFYGSILRQVRSVSTRIELRQETSRPFSAENFSASNLTQQAALLLSSSLSLPTSFSEHPANAAFFRVSEGGKTPLDCLRRKSPEVELAIFWKAMIFELWLMSLFYNT